MSPLRTPANVVSFALKMRSERDGNQSEWESTRKISHKHQEIREELGAIVDGEGNPFKRMRWKGRSLIYYDHTLKIVNFVMRFRNGWTIVDSACDG